MEYVNIFLQNWIPYKLNNQNPELCEWLYTGGINFTEPFFSDSILQCKNLPQNCKHFKSLSHLSMLKELGYPDKIPTAIIFHISRCGSTLFSQLLALDELQHIVFSEPSFFDELLRIPFKEKKMFTCETSTLLKSAINCYSNLSPDKKLFIKTDSWHLHFYEQWRSLYRDTPFILLYRNPYEVILSQQKKRGMQSVPGIIEPALFGFDTTLASESNLDKYMGSVLKSYFEKMTAITKYDSLAFPLNYADGPMAIIKKIYKISKLDFTAMDEKKIKERILYHAKYPQQIFEEETPNLKMPDFILPVMDMYYQLDTFKI